jgi:hypothetical protein
LFFTSGFRIGRLAYFQIRKPHYEHLLSEAQNSGEVPSGKGYTDNRQPTRFVEGHWYLRGFT